jgi:hypothetical protein
MDGSVMMIASRMLGSMMEDCEIERNNAFTIAYRNSNHRNINTNYSIWNIVTIFGRGNVPTGALDTVS